MQKTIKCVVWDLDDTLWDGTITEQADVFLKPGIVDLIKTLDDRGILQSVASRNDYQLAFSKLETFGLHHYFLYPQINWGDKSGSLETIRQCLNIGIETIAFVDDQPVERMEVQAKYPDVYCIDAKEYLLLKTDARFIPARVTEDSRNRRLMYQQDISRNIEEERLPANDPAFLKSLNMELLISLADEKDLERAEELTLRTNQLNATGQIYTYEQLKQVITDKDYRLILCELRDRFGSYGKIGLILLSLKPSELHIELMLFSCRVISRGIGTVILHYLYKRAQKQSCRLTASFKDTGTNRMMYMTYRMAGFINTNENTNGCEILEFKSAQNINSPTYILITDNTL